MKQCKKCGAELEPLEACGCAYPPAASDNVAQAQQPTIYFDMDGVLADFDGGAERILGTNNIYKYEFVYGQEAFWDALNTDGNFFEGLHVLPGARRMVGAVSHLTRGVITALPKTNGQRVHEQKKRWIKYDFPELYGNMITCLTHEKPNYCKPGDVLIDDRAVNKAAWEAKGGRFIVHTDVGSTLTQLKSMGLVK